MILCARQMLNTVTADECNKLLAGEGGAIIGDKDVRESMSGEDQPNLLYCGLRSSRVDNMSLYPLRM